jgi:zinc and cadmium transporter
MLASLSGITLASRVFADFMKRNLHFLVSFSAGVFLVVTYGLAQEALEHNTLQIGLLWILIGCVATWILMKMIPESHHHHEEGSDHIHSNIDARRIVLADTVHNLGDGILLAGAFAVSTAFGIITAVGVLIHEILEEISEFFVMKEAGWSTKKALAINFFTSSSILVGAIGAYFLFETMEHAEPILLALAAGVFLVVVLQDLIPHSIRKSSEEKHICLKKHIVWFLFGIILMSGVNTLLSHEHESEKSHTKELQTSQKM